MRTGMLSVIPSVNLVCDIGFGDGVTHATGVHALVDLGVKEMQFPLRHPQYVRSSEQSDQRTARLLYWRAGPLKRLLRSFAKRLTRRTEAANPALI